MIPQASLFLGIIPALLLLFISLKGYENHYKEKNIFVAFVIGIFIGCIATVIEILTKDIGIFYIVLYPILEQLFKTIALNIGRLQEKKQTTIYGLTLGLGFGSIFTPISLIMGNFQTTDPILMGLVVIGSIGFILFHAATGLLIGYGIYLGQLYKYLLYAVILHIPVTAIVLITNYYQIGYTQMMLIPYGAILYWYATRRLMPKILDEHQRRKRSRNTQTQIK